MARLESVSVLGAGPAGLSAAISLASHGVRVTVYEQRQRVGGRFHGDFQGLENWTTEEDVLSWLEGIGLALQCPFGPMNELTLVDPVLRPWRVRGERPLLYLVKRGPGRDCLDRALLSQAQAMGVHVECGRKVDPTALTGPVIVATGPQATQAVVAGIVARTSLPDQVVAIAWDYLAPKCYAYCVIWRGRATVAAALASDFSQAWTCFDRTRKAFARMGLADFHDERRFGGRASICLGRPLQEDNRLYVGEAAGLQDYFLGFGLRYALLSGHLAARSLLTGESYAALVDASLGRGFRAGFVNRVLYNRLGDRGYRWFIRWVSRAPNVRARARWVYSFTPFHQLLWPLVRTVARRRGGTLTA